MQDFAALIQACESDIRLGRSQDAARRLNSVNPYKVPRDWRLPVANLCRRTGQIASGLKLLLPIVYAEFNRKAEPPSARELAEYAVLLLRSGSVAEALRTLERVDVKQVPEAYLYRAFAHFARWDYPEAVPNLEKYLHFQLAPYAELVGRVNLAAALVATTRYQEALELLNVIIEKAKASGAVRLLGNSLELRAQIHIDWADYKSARANLNEAASLFSADPSVSQAFVTKWLAVIDGLETGSTERLMAFRSESLQRKDWESVRESDLFISKIAFDRQRFEHLYFGTSFPYYRKMIERYVGYKITSNEFLFGDPLGLRMDLVSGRVEGLETEIPGKNMHRLIAGLLRDFYRPRSLGGIFDEVFPGEHFNIFHTPDRIHQLMRRTRIWLRENSIPIEIAEDHGTYRLVISGPFAFRIPLEVRAKESEELQFQRVREAFARKGRFSAREAREKLGLPKSSFNRLIHWAIAHGRIQISGASTSTIYEFVDSVGDGELKAAA
jgi:tetratricopeptide (TPR) repeat protein